jgi:uncharacterized protein
MFSRRAALIGLSSLAGASLAPQSFFAQQPIALPTDKIADRFALVHPANVKLEGWLGERAQKNARNRLLTKNESDLLGGFQQRPGKQAWVGEHVGKWMHAATLAWVATGNLELRAKLDRVASALMATQQPDGYLGTYANGAHFAMGKDEKWDVWVHKYNLIGLLTYATYTGNLAALESAKRIGNLLVTNFGAGSPPGGSIDINERSTHVGMASGSVLEPMVLLYRATGDIRYLDFARLIVEKWEATTGPKLVSALSASMPVNKVANAKAYEMLSFLVGLCELYRATGEARYLNPALNAWIDITTNQLLITGSGSSKERWTDARQFASDVKDEVAETCVSVTWIQFNQQLLRLTGMPKYADELEKTFLNHLAAAQRPDGAEWCYFTAHNGKKTYKAEQNCCTSSGPRGWALLPTFAYQISEDGIVVNFFTNGTANLKLPNGKTVAIKQETNYPHEGRVKLTVAVAEPMKFSLRVRVPTWSSLAGLKSRSGDYWLLRQTWSKTQTIVLDLTLPTRVIPGEGKNAGRVALARGPVVLAVDEALNPGLMPLTALALATTRPTITPHATLKDADGNPVYETSVLLTQDTANRRRGDRVTLLLSAFAAAGATGKEYAVWLGAPLGTMPS